MSDGEITALAILLAGLLAAEAEGRAPIQPRRRERAESEPARAECGSSA